MTQTSADRSANVLEHFCAQIEAIGANRPLCFLSQRPYDPFRDSDPQAAAPSPPPPPPRTCCVDCWGTGLIRTGDGWNEPRSEEYCTCQAGLDLEAAEAEELERMESAA